jgi:hypothetical protein
MQQGDQSLLAASNTKGIQHNKEVDMDACLPVALKTRGFNTRRGNPPPHISIIL